MHTYSLSKNFREIVNTILVSSSILILLILEYLQCEDRMYAFFGIEQGFWYVICKVFWGLLPFSIYGGVTFVYNHYVWRWKLLQNWHGVPDLAGRWEGVVVSELKEQDVPIMVIVEQTWTKIKIRTKTAKARAYSDSAIIESTESGEIYVRYSFINVDENNVSYQGYNRLRFAENELAGNYFTEKEIPGECGRGSKGKIYLQKE
ncbi:MAG: hypothetical protein Q4D32_08540 [Eubacteriales bacterium]|nr:hypothetical protein [Eubacteriales bacterium]